MEGGREGREKRTVYKLSRRDLSKIKAQLLITSSNEAIYTLKSYFQEDIQICPWIS